MLIKRRHFLQAGSMATASLMVPQFLKAFGKSCLPGTNDSSKIVVVLQLSGGNDGLNTVIPVRNDIYYRSRPRLSIEKENALPLNDDAAIHPSLPAFKKLYDEGGLAILNNVGYPNPDRSHFRSMDIWQSASTANQYISTGWIGRYLDAQCGGCGKPTQAIEADDVLSLALKGVSENGIAVKDPGRLFKATQQNDYAGLAKNHVFHKEEQPVDYLYKTLTETVNSAAYIFEQSKKHPATSKYPPTDLGNRLKTIATLILSGINTRIYYVSHGSFDTHVNQKAAQDRLFKQMNDAVEAFVSDLRANNRFNDVLLFTFSEFGRRVVQNASIGTDHGTANNMFFISGALKQKGLLNEMPDLENLVDGDLQFNVDFKNVYASILNNWLQTDAGKILGGSYSYLDFI